MQTPLHLAVLTRQPSVVRRLVVAGASLSPRDRYGNTAVHLASEAGDVDCLRALVEPVTVQEASHAVPQDPADLEERNYDGKFHALV